MYCILFLWFVHYNHGIVLGDQSNHQFSLHLSQVSTFSSKNVLDSLLRGSGHPSRAGRSLPPILSTAIVNSFQVVAEEIVVFCTVFVCVLLHVLYCLMISHESSCFKFMIVHPFLLSDNRHYTFYFYSKILKVLKMML